MATNSIRNFYKKQINLYYVCKYQIVIKMKEYTYMLTSSLRTIVIFFTISLSLTMFSMDYLVVAKKKLSGYDRPELEKKNKNPLALSIIPSKNFLGPYFGTFSPDLLNN